MRYLIIFLFFGFTCHSQIPPVLWHLQEDTISSWSYHFGDEFNVQKVDESIWFDHYPWGGLSLDAGIYAAPEMVKTDGKFIHLSVDTTSAWREFPDWMLPKEQLEKYQVNMKGNSMQLNYLTAALWSKKQFKYGYFECRCRVPKGKGLWPGFWLYGGNPNEEIDFMEMKGERTNQVHVDIHCPDRCDQVPRKPFGNKKPWGAWIKADKELAGEWAIFSGIWMPGYITFYLNGEAIAHFKGDFKTEMNLIANMAVAQDGGPFSPGPDETTNFPGTFDIDYMRVWKLDDNWAPLPLEMFQSKSEDLIRINSRSINNAQLKKGKNYSYPRKKMEKDHGFVSVLPYGPKTIQIQFSGVQDQKYALQIWDAEKKNMVKSWNLIQENGTTFYEDFLELQGVKSGKYLLLFQSVSAKGKVNNSKAIPFTLP